MTLKDFPRGGKKTITRASSNFLFDRKEKIKNKKTRSKKIDNEQLHSEECIVPSTAQCLKYSSLSEGMVILGRVSTSTEYDVSISLPGRLRGNLPLTNIARAYNNLLQNLIENRNGDSPEFKSLNELYRRGDNLVCYVKCINSEEKHQITLSIEPELINRSLDPEKLQKGNRIVCSISGVEEHGYVVDTGMTVLRGFLSIQDIDDGVKYYPGQQIFCAVKSVKLIENVTTVKLSTKSKDIKSVVAIDNQYLDAIVPNTSMVLTITNILSNGLRVTFHENHIGFINQLYLKKSLASYKEGADIIGKLLYVLPTVKFAYFSEVWTEPNDESIKIGDIIEKAKFLYRESNGIVLHLKEGVRGFVSFKRTGIDFDAISSKFIQNSIHKCRIIAYDIFDRLYICSMEQNMLKDTFIARGNAKPGDILTVEVIRINENGFAFVKAGDILGDVPPEHMINVGTELDKKVQPGAKIKARVLGNNKQGNGLLFTLKKSLVDSKLPILSDIEDAEVGSKFNGVITCVNQRGLLVTFFNNVKGWVPSIKLPKQTGGTLNYSIGQVVMVKIDKINKKDGKLFLSFIEDTSEVKEQIQFEIGETVEGVVVESSINGAYVNIAHESNNVNIIGFLPAGHIAPCSEIASYLSSRYVPGDKISALVFSTSPDVLLTQTYAPKEEYTNLNKLQIGNCIPCSIKEINNKTGLKVVLPIKALTSYGTVSLNRVDNIEALYTHQILFGKILNINKKEGKISLTTSLTDVWHEAVEQEVHMIGAVDQLTLYLNRLKELSIQPYYKSKAVSSINLGERVTGVIDKVTDYGLVLKLNNNVAGIVRPSHYKGTFNIGDEVSATVLWINFIHELVEVTMLPMLANSISERQSKLPQAALETQLRGEIVLVTNWFVLVVLKGQGKGRLAVLPSRRHTNDVQPNLISYTIGKKIRCYVVLNKDESELLPVCLIKSAFELRKKIVMKESKIKKRKNDNPKESDDFLIKKLKRSGCVDIKTEYQEAEKCKSVKTAKKPENIDRRMVETTKAEFDAREDNESDSIIKDVKAEEIAKSLSLPEHGFFWDVKPTIQSTEDRELSSGSSSEEENDALLQQQIKKKKLNPAERREMMREKEREIREREKALISNQIPNSVDQFDRLVLASPDSSKVWLQYMAYHLQSTEIDKARSIAKRALKTINFREENEKLNVWQAWLNLESRFGTPESLNDVFQQAINVNESKNIYFHMLTVHADAGRHAELEKVVKTVTGKFKQLPQMWIEVGAALLRVGLKDKSRHIMQRAIQSLPLQEHVNLMVKFAQLENKFGDKERAQTLFDQILSSYPKRIDVWSTYVDSLVKSGDFHTARQVLNKAVIQTLPPRKIRTLFKKFIDFEEQHGTPEGVAHARELAVAYVEKQCSNEVN